MKLKNVKLEWGKSNVRWYTFFLNKKRKKKNNMVFIGKKNIWLDSSNISGVCK